MEYHIQGTKLMCKPFEEKMHLTKGPSPLFEALRQEMVTLFAATRPKGLK